METDIADIVVAHTFSYSLLGKGVFLCFWLWIVCQFLSISWPIGCTNSGGDVCCLCHLVICGILLVVVVVAYLSTKIA